jgi:hypothetical protein
MKRMMRRRSIFGAAGGGAGLFAVGRDPALAFGSSAPAADTATSANISVVRRWIDEVVNGGRLEVADEIFAPTFISHPDGGTVATVKRTAARWRSGHYPGHAALEDIVASGDRVAVRITWHRAAHVGAGVRAGRAHPAALGMAIFRIAEGRIVEGWGLTERTRAAT